MSSVDFNLIQNINEPFFGIKLNYAEKCVNTALVLTDPSLMISLCLWQQQFLFLCRLQIPTIQFEQQFSFRY
jgi:hypothetical protein